MSELDLSRRSVLWAPLVLAAAGCMSHAQQPGNRPVSSTGPVSGNGGGPDPNETFVLPYEHIAFAPWGDIPPASGEMATLYGDLNKPGPYLVMMRWRPGWFSAPHMYATDRICVVVFGTWWVNSGPDFRPQDAVAVGPGGYVKRTAHTPHYDGVPQGQADPAVIAISGLGPVDIQLVDPTKPSWRQV
ncbi:tat pathway signal sequence [Mycobacterium sp.]|uniref:tat pathway signal sequence n=1 Tax=Mycobacterium sp. TaxID=1785 RepID=UPI002D559336|nr:tat pathway signal sequence [Mycobacterium sp.]HZA08862.1 tat pathway signal sequence [Mycobacterium sp.]